MANRQVPKFSLNNCAQSSKKTFMCPKFCTNPVLKYTKCHISTNLSNFLKLHLLYCQNLFLLASANRRFAEKNRLSGNTVQQQIIFSNMINKALENPTKCENRTFSLWHVAWLEIWHTVLRSVSPNLEPEYTKIALVPQKSLLTMLITVWQVGIIQIFQICNPEKGRPLCL